ncbi:MAG: hypothetical protein JWM90_2140 [Thermoleophilia bacterium]|nr:hypothetical protein [Thermoleophilia bacterium]
MPRVHRRAGVGGRGGVRQQWRCAPWRSPVRPCGADPVPCPASGHQCAATVCPWRNLKGPRRIEVERRRHQRAGACCSCRSSTVRWQASREHPEELAFVPCQCRRGFPCEYVPKCGQTAPTHLLRRATHAGSSSGPGTRATCAISASMRAPSSTLILRRARVPRARDDPAGRRAGSARRTLHK